MYDFFDSSSLVRCDLKNLDAIDLTISQTHTHRVGVKIPPKTVFYCNNFVRGIFFSISIYSQTEQVQNDGY